MKILIAGATGAIGRPLVDLLIQDGHEIFGITQSKERALMIAGKGAKPVILDILDRTAVLSAVEGIKPEVVIDMLTSLPKEYTPESMRQAAEKDALIRREGGKNLLEAAKAAKTKRHIVQSSAFWYVQGRDLADENTPFAHEASPGVIAGVSLYEEIEERALRSGPIEAVALRFGFFYGPGTWFHPGGDAALRVKNKEFPIIGNGEGIWNFVHIEDAAKACASAVYCYPGAYNIVNDRPSPMKEWLPAFARFVKAPPPPWIDEEEGAKRMGADAVYYATKLRGASNSKARAEFNFQPRGFEWFL